MSHSLRHTSLTSHSFSSPVLFSQEHYQHLFSNMDIDEETSEEYREPKVRHNVHESTTYELAEEELKAEERKFLRNYDSRNND